MRVSFLVDGFNLYHSIRDLEAYTGSKAKWLDLKSLFSSYLPQFGRQAVLTQIHYFSALPNYLSNVYPDRIQRHKDYIKCLEDTGVIVNLGRFKKREIECKRCSRTFSKHEEKETDVSIGVKLVELFLTDQADTIVIVSGDTDLSPAIRTATRNFPEKHVCICFPYRRKNNELSRIATLISFKIKEAKYISNQFQDPYTLSTGAIVSKPTSW